MNNGMVALPMLMFTTHLVVWLIERFQRSNTRSSNPKVSIVFFLVSLMDMLAILFSISMIIDFWSLEMFSLMTKSSPNSMTKPLSLMVMMKDMMLLSLQVVTTRHLLPWTLLIPMRVLMKTMKTHSFLLCLPLILLCNPVLLLL